MLRDKKVRFRCDNLAAVWIAIKKSACLDRPDLNGLMKVFCNIAWEYNFRIFSDHIKGKDNIDADDLSRLFRLISDRKKQLADKPLMVTDKVTLLLNNWNRIQVRLGPDNKKFKKRYFTKNVKGDSLECGCSDWADCNKTKLHRKTWTKGTVTSSKVFSLIS